MSKDGGPAFPKLQHSDHYVSEGWSSHSSSEGMSLHDVYVGQIMQGFCANPAVFASNGMTGWGLLNTTPEQLIEYAREIATVMLKARGNETE